MRRRTGPVALLAVVSALAAPACGADSHATSTGRADPTGVPARQAAVRDARILLGRLALPAAARRLDSEPTGDRGVLAHPAQGPPATPNAVDEYAFWLIPGSAELVIAYIHKHPPQGSRQNISGRTGVGGRTQSQVLGFGWPPVANVLGIRWLIVQLVPLADGKTALRADAQTVWITPRPGWEQIPSGARLLRVTVHRGSRQLQRPVRVTSAAKIDRIRGIVNALPAAQPGSTSCPADTGVAITMRFYRQAHASPLAVAIVSPEGCGGVQLTIGGRPGPLLAGGTTLAAQLRSLLPRQTTR